MLISYAPWREGWGAVHRYGDGRGRPDRFCRKFCSGNFAQGVRLHSTFALPEQGALLSVLGLQAWARPAGNAVAPEARESGKWLHGIAQARQIMWETAWAVGAAAPPRMMHLMDREGDVYEVLQWLEEVGDAGGGVGAAPGARRRGPALVMVDTGAGKDVGGGAGSGAERHVLLADRGVSPHVEERLSYRSLATGELGQFGKGRSDVHQCRSPDGGVTGQGPAGARRAGHGVAE